MEKFVIGDKVKRVSNRENRIYLIMGTFVENHPFYKKVWYYGIDSKDEIFKCLKSIMEEDFELVEHSPLPENLRERFASEDF